MMDIQLRRRIINIVRQTLLISLWLSVAEARAETAPVAATLPAKPLPDALIGQGDQQLIHQQDQQRALQNRLKPQAPDIRLSAPSGNVGHLRFAQETPCFTLTRVTLSGTDALPHWLPLQRISHQPSGGGEMPWRTGDQPADEHPAKSPG